MLARGTFNPALRRNSMDLPSMTPGLPSLGNPVAKPMAPVPAESQETMERMRRLMGEDAFRRLQNPYEHDMDWFRYVPGGDLYTPPPPKGSGFQGTMSTAGSRPAAPQMPPWMRFGQMPMGQGSRPPMTPGDMARSQQLAALRPPMPETMTGGPLGILQSLMRFGRPNQPMTPARGQNAQTATRPMGAGMGARAPGRARTSSTSTWRI